MGTGCRQTDWVESGLGAPRDWPDCIRARLRMGGLTAVAGAWGARLVASEGCLGCSYEMQRCRALVNLTQQLSISAQPLPLP
jgi:hypothetical protein